MTNFTTKERQHIISDIAHWKVELEHTGGRSFSDDDLDNYVERLSNSTDAELEASWYDSVGEWVASRRDIPVPDDTTFEDWLDNQFSKVKSGQETPWGYVVGVAVPEPCPS